MEFKVEEILEVNCSHSSRNILVRGHGKWITTGIQWHIDHLNVDSRGRRLDTGGGLGIKKSAVKFVALLTIVIIKVMVLEHIYREMENFKP